MYTIGGNQDYTKNNKMFISSKNQTTISVIINKNNKINITDVQFHIFVV